MQRCANLVLEQNLFSKNIEKCAVSWLDRRRYSQDLAGFEKLVRSVRPQPETQDRLLIEDLEEDAQSGSLATHVWGSTHALRSTCFSGLVRSGPPFSAGLNCRFSLASGDDWSLEDLQSLKRIPSSDPPRNWSSQEVLHSSY